MKLALLTPLPPTRSGIAHYAAMLIPELEKHAEVRAFETLEGYRRGDYDQVVYQLGNNPFHETAYREAMREPGVVVLHDLVLHHLIVEMTLARGDVEGYVEALRANHGAAGEAWARGRAAGLHAEIANFLMPASVEVANRSRAVIVHNRYAADRLSSFGVTTPIHVVPHPYVAGTVPAGRDETRRRFGIEPGQRVIGFFGFLTSAKRAEVVLEAFRVARARDERLLLLVAGEPAPNIDPALLQGAGIVSTGYVADDEFPSLYLAADRLVNLRYPSAGESSGTLIRALDAGKPVAVSDYAQFAEFPDSCVVKIPLGGDEVQRLAAFFCDEIPSPAAAQRAWLDANARMDLAVQGYLRAIGGAPGGSFAKPAAAGMPIFPDLELTGAHADGDRLTLEVRNRGRSVVRTRTYGSPELRLVATFFRGEVPTGHRWLALPGDLHPGQTASVEVSVSGTPTEVRLLFALQDVPVVDTSGELRTEIRRVR